MSTSAEQTRRNPMRLAVCTAPQASALAALAPSASATDHESAAGIELYAQTGFKPRDEELLFLKQLGTEFVNVAPGPNLRTVVRIKQRYADAGTTGRNIGNIIVYNMPELTLNLPARDAKIDEYKQYLRNLGRAPIYYTSSAHMANGACSNGRANIQVASARKFDIASPNKVGVEPTGSITSRSSTGANTLSAKSGIAKSNSSARWRQLRNRLVSAPGVALTQIKSVMLSMEMIDA